MLPKYFLPLSINLSIVDLSSFLSITFADLISNLQNFADVLS